MKKLLVSALLVKSQVAAFTRKDGSMVQSHDNGKNAAAPADFGVHHKDLKEGDHLFDKHGQKVDEVEGFSRGVNSAVVHTRAGYSHSTHQGFLPGLSNKKPGASSREKKTGAKVPAKMVNAGTAKWPLNVKSSAKLGSAHADGSTHHVGGFKPPEYPANGGGTEGDTSVHHGGKLFSFSGKSGKNMKTGEKSYEYSHHDEKAGLEHRAWVTASGHLSND